MARSNSRVFTLIAVTCDPLWQRPDIWNSVFNTAFSGICIVKRHEHEVYFLRIFSLPPQIIATHGHLWILLHLVKYSFYMFVLVRSALTRTVWWISNFVVLHFFALRLMCICVTRILCSLHNYWSRDSSVCIVPGLRDGRSKNGCSIPSRGKRYVLKFLNWLRGYPASR